MGTTFDWAKAGQCIIGCRLAWTDAAQGSCWRSWCLTSTVFGCFAAYAVGGMLTNKSKQHPHARFWSATLPRLVML